MARILDIGIDFPDVTGKSTRQAWYAEQLRENYVIQNEERFREIDNLVQRECDKRSFDYIDEELPTISEDFTENERIVLFCHDAGAIISKLKRRTKE